MIDKEADNYVQFSQAFNILINNDLRYKLKDPIFNLTDKVFNNDSRKYLGDWDLVSPDDYYENM